MFNFIFLFFRKFLTKNKFLVFLVLIPIKSQAFLAETLKAKEQLESVGMALKSLTDTAPEAQNLLKIEDNFLAFEKELREFQETLDEYEKLGLDVKDFIEFRNTDPNSFKEQLDFLKDYIKRANKLIESFSSLLKSPEAITASEQTETNRTLRALLKDNQSRELRKLRREIAREKLRLEHRKKEQEFINKQYTYINRHSRKTGFGVFHPFDNKKDLERNSKRKNKNEDNMRSENKLETNKRKKFLGIF